MNQDKLQIGLNILSYILLITTNFLNWMLFKFAITKKQKEINKSSRRKSKTILKGISMSLLVYTLTSTITNLHHTLQHHLKYVQLETLCTMDVLINETFYILVTSQVALLLFHRYNHMVSQAIGREAYIKRSYCYILFLCIISAILLMAEIFAYLKILEPFFHIFSILINTSMFLAILFVLLYAIVGTKKEIKNRYKGFILTWNTLNGQFLYVTLFIIYFSFKVLRESGLTDTLKPIKILGNFYFLILLVLYYTNDRNFRSYVKKRTLRGPPVVPIESAKSVRKRKRTRGSATFTLCSRCKLPQFKDNEVSSSSSQVVCERCGQEENEENEEIDRYSVISQLEGLELRRKDISTPVKLLITSAFHIKAAHGILAKENVVATHWKKVSLKKRSKSQQNCSNEGASSGRHSLGVRSQSDQHIVSYGT
eukprot:TCONS_00020086-protein